MEFLPELETEYQYFWKEVELLENNFWQIQFEIYKVKKNWKDIGLIVAILLNVFQFISDEAKDWYALTQQAKPSVTQEKSINMGMAGRIDREDVKEIAKGVK